MEGKTIIGLTEDIVVLSPHGEKVVHARIDTGATISSIDANLAAELKLGPIEEVKRIKNANGIKVRPALRAKIRLAERSFEALFTLADRSHMKYRALIGQDILKHGFLIDPSKNTLLRNNESSNN